MTVAALKEAATGTAVAKKEPPKNFPAMLQQWKGEIANALPRHLNADRMARIALTCFRNTPKLAECNPHSVFAAVLQAAQLGIEPGLTGEAYLIPYKDSCQLIPGYAGLIKLAKQTGQVVDIYAMSVREKDKFHCTYGLTRTLEHVPLSKSGGFPASQAERGDIIGVYAVAVFKDGSRTFVLMGRDEIERIRDGSSGYQMAKKYKKDSPWTTHFEEMALKTAIRRLCKTLPKSAELAQAIALEDAHNAGKAQNIDMHSALDGSYTPPSSGEFVDVDPETGEVIDQPEASAGQVSAAEQQKSASKAPAGLKATDPAKPPKLLYDALALIDEKRYEDAEAIAADEKNDLSDNDRAEIRANVRKAKNGEQA